MLFDLTSFAGFLVNFCASYLKFKFKTFQREICRSESNDIRTHNHLFRKRTLNHLAQLASLAKWLSVRLRTKWFWVRISLLSVKAIFSNNSIHWNFFLSTSACCRWMKYHSLRKKDFQIYFSQ